MYKTDLIKIAELSETTASKISGLFKNQPIEFLVDRRLELSSAPLNVANNFFANRIKTDFITGGLFQV